VGGKRAEGLSVGLVKVVSMSVKNPVREGNVEKGIRAQVREGRNENTGNCVEKKFIRKLIQTFIGGARKGRKYTQGSVWEKTLDLSLRKLGEM